jgi:hypothetical protein
MNGRRAIIVAAMALGIATVARSGHESSVYPSYYPHEIEIVTAVPERAADLLLAGKIQAYVGNSPRFAGTPPATIDSVASLGSFVIVRVNPTSPLIKAGTSACAIINAFMRNLAGASGDFAFHPYPVTPFHGDYLHHADLAEAAKVQAVSGPTNSSNSGLSELKIRADGEVARTIVRPERIAQGSEWDVEVGEVGAAGLVASATHSTNGWLGPAWLRTGWYHAALLLGEHAGEEELKCRVDRHLNRLQMADYADAIERINLERSLVASLAGGCHVRVAGYTVKREYFSTVFTAGIENIAYDSIEGFNSPMFMRTVKLKDFPWNGWLTLGIDAAPEAAWNPIAGFTDEFGRLLWSAVGDPALIPSPNESAWMLNRITDVQSSAKQ